jgi:hypothetical protein
LKSRPLNRDLAKVSLALDTFDPLDERIKAKALENLANSGRCGCTTDEIYDLIQSFVSGILKQVVAEIFEEVTESNISEQFERVVTLTQRSISKYINETGEWSGKQIESKLSKRLLDWGLTKNETQSKDVISSFSRRLQKAAGIQDLTNSIPLFKREEDHVVKSDDKST